MTTSYLLPKDLQQINETMYARAHIDGYIRQELKGSADTVQKLREGEQMVQDFLQGSYYAAKELRLQQLQGLNLARLVEDIFVGVAYCQTPQLFTSVSAQLASRIGLSDRREAIQTMGELLAVLCLTDAFDITKAHASASLMVESRIPLSDKLQRFIRQSQYLPPMVCAPRIVKHNRQSPYLSIGADSQILGKGNHHEGDICLDVLNTLNQQALRLDTTFLSTVEEEPTFELDTPEKAQQWRTFKQESYAIYDLLTHQGNHFYVTWKVDKRGRLYSQGYHVNPQGTAFKKAMLEFADEEVVTGVPSV